MAKKKSAVIAAGAYAAVAAVILLAVAVTRTIGLLGAVALFAGLGVRMGLKAARLGKELQSL